MTDQSPNPFSEIAWVKCPECDDQVHPHLNYCPRCLVALYPDENEIEIIREIDTPPGVDCYIRKAKDGSIIYVYSKPTETSKKLFLMTTNDLLVIKGEEDRFYRVRLPNGDDGYVDKEMGIRVKIGTAEIEPAQAWGYYRVSEHLIGWKTTKPPFLLPHVCVWTEPHSGASVIAEIKSDIILPIVGETYGWLEVQLPSFFRGWVPEAYGYRMLRSNSLPELTRPLTSSEILGQIVGIAGVVTLLGVGAAVSAAFDS